MRTCGLDGTDSVQLAPHDFVVSRENEWAGAVRRVARGRGTSVWTCHLGGTGRCLRVDCFDAELTHMSCFARVSCNLGFGY